MSTETHTVMDPRKLEVKSTIPTKEIGYASIGLALYTRVGNSSPCYCHCRGGYGTENRQRNGRGNGRHMKHRCTHCKLDSHTTEECGKRKAAQSGSGNRKDYPGKGGNDERTCYQCGLPGHPKANCIHYKRVQERRTKVKKASR
ncbi:hypothetical protein BDD12DRAFT_810982 [Trichophaea hybrida]|nr:hypothetical protein BDD12DRAFT_810982 [Trichophaea hybrida]